MIVEMKKVVLVLLREKKEKALGRLKKLGVVHIEGTPGVSARTMEIEDTIGRLERAFFSLKKPVKAEKQAAYTSMEKALARGREITDILDRMALLKEENAALAKELERLEPLGEFDPRDIRLLEEKGRRVKLFQPARGEAPEEGMPNSFVVHRGKRGNILALVLGPNDPVPEYTEMTLPEVGPAELRARLEGNKRSLQELAERHAGCRVCAEMLKEAMRILDDELTFERVRVSMGEDEGLTYLTGWVPLKKVSLIKEAAVQNGWACLVKEAEEGEEPPTLVENNRVIRIISPIFTFLGTVPGYREYDVSFWFLLFFCLFVGMIIGDGGYGTLLLLSAVFITVRLKKLPDALKLLYVLAAATVGWGAVTGTWFASETLAEQPLFKALTVQSIASRNPESGKTVMYLSFIIGLAHLCIAHIRSVIRKSPRLAALADIGWISLVVGLFFLVLNLVLDAEKYPLPNFAPHLVGGGFAFLILFGQQEKGRNFFKGILMGISGLLTTALSCISCFGDIISYIRLYAVGLATVAISQTFNGMAASIMDGGGGLIFLAVVILFLGHSLNILMAILSVIVHGIRLNMLEFSGHLGMQWTGYGYRPFREGGGR